MWLPCSSQNELLDEFSADTSLGVLSCPVSSPAVCQLPPAAAWWFVVPLPLLLGHKGTSTCSSDPRLELEFLHPFPLLVREEAELTAQQQCIFILETYTQSSSVFWFLKRQNSLEPVQRDRLVQARWETLPERGLAGAAASRVC